MKTVIAPVVFFITLVTLMAELLLTRVFDIITTPNMAYMVITTVMFSFGLAGVYSTLRPGPDRLGIHTHLSRLAFGFGLATALILPVLNLVPFDYELFFQEPFRQAVYFGVMYVALMAPFFFAGLMLTTIFSLFSGRIHRLYFFDLAGAALGCIVFVPFLPLIGPGGLLMICAAIGFMVSAVYAERPFSIWANGAAACGLIALPILHYPNTFDFVEHVAKRGVKEAREAGRVELSRWDPISKIDVIDQPEWNSKHVAYDGGTQSTTLFEFDGDLKKLRRELFDDFKKQFWNRGVVASHWLKEGTDHKVLIVGSAGGQETKAALTFGAGHIDAIEMVGTVVDLVSGPYSEFIGNVFRHPHVHVRVGEGRSFLRAQESKYDVIQIFSNYTSSSIASGSGALSTTYLQTVDAYLEYFNHLESDGILHINHHIYPRMITTAAEAWHRLGRTDFRKHVVVFEREGQDNLPTFLVKMTPWNVEEVAKLNDLFFAPLQDRERPFRLVENPIEPETSFLPDPFYSYPLPANLVAKAAFHTTPTHDDRPYFGFLRKRLGDLEPDRSAFLNESTARFLNSQMKKSIIPMDLIHLFVTGFFALVFGSLFVIVPLLFSTVGRESWPNKIPILGYFACLGGGFIIYELVLIQIFMKLIGYPLYCYSIVVFTLLLGSGIGSLVSHRLGTEGRSGWKLPFLGILATGLVFLFSHNFLFNVLLTQPIALRILVSFLLILPIGFFLGMPFPMGIKAVRDMPRGAIAWCWGLNSLFTVIGGFLTVVISIYLGFRVTLTVALLIYGVAFALFARIKASDHTNEPGQQGKAKIPTISPQREQVALNDLVLQNRAALGS